MFDSAICFVLKVYHELSLAGISTAIQLKKQLHFENFTVCWYSSKLQRISYRVNKIYEKANAVGGTWRVRSFCFKRRSLLNSHSG